MLCRRVLDWCAARRSVGPLCRASEDEALRGIRHFVAVLVVHMVGVMIELADLTGQQRSGEACPGYNGVASYDMRVRAAECHGLGRYENCGLQLRVRRQSTGLGQL